MKRALSVTLTSVSLCIALAMGGCAAETGSGAGPAAATDTAVAADAAKTDTAAGVAADTVADTGPAAVDAAAEVAAPPCGGPCKADETCDAATNKCVAKPKVGCDPACKAGEFCDLADKKCKAMTCKFPEKWGPDVQKISALSLAPAAEGCDLDGDGKVNNALTKALATFQKQANDGLDKGVKDGSLVIAMETAGFKSDGTEFTTNILVGDVDASNKTCDVVNDTANCKYTASINSYDFKAATPACPPVVSFPNFKVDKGAMTAGGPKQVFAFSLPITDIILTLKISQAKLQGEVAGTTKWEGTKKGLICGAVVKKDIEAAIDAVPDEQLAKLMDKATLKGLLATLLVPDIDVDGDGTKEAVSVAIKFETVGGQITGMTPPK